MRCSVPTELEQSNCQVKDQTLTHSINYGIAKIETVNTGVIR